MGHGLIRGRGSPPRAALGGRLGRGAAAGAFSGAVPSLTSFRDRVLECVAVVVLEPQPDTPDPRRPPGTGTAPPVGEPSRPPALSPPPSPAPPPALRRGRWRRSR